MEHRLRPKRIILDGIKSKRKKLEIRVRDERRAAIETGDVLVFDFGDQEYRRRVVAIRQYDSFEKALAAENISFIMPDWSEQAILAGLRSIYTKEKESLGVLVFELEIIS